MSHIFDCKLVSNPAKKSYFKLYHWSFQKYSSVASYSKIKYIFLKTAYKFLRLKSKLLNMAYKLLPILTTVCLISVFMYTSSFQLSKSSKSFATYLCKCYFLCLECLFLPVFTLWLILSHLSGISSNVTSLKWLFCNSPPSNQVYVSIINFYSTFR